MRGRSVATNGAEDEQANETEDRRGIEGADCLGGVTGASDGSGPCGALRGSPESDLCVEEAALGTSGSRLRGRGWQRCRGQPGTRDREAARQDRSADGRAGFFSQEVRKMSAPDRRARLDRDHSDLSIRRQCRLLSVARSNVYRLPRPTNDDDLLMKRLIDE